MNRNFIRNPYNEKDISACGLFGLINKDGKRVSGGIPIRAIANMHDRGNGLGGGFAGYGIYPHMSNFFALHLMYDSENYVPDVETYLTKHVEVVRGEEISVYTGGKIKDHPFFKRYFVQPKETALKDGFTEQDAVVELVMNVNKLFEHAYVISSGKNMGAFKGVGFPEDIGEFFRLDEYEGYIWTAHNRFPTNSPGWWGGAHPFTLLDWSIVHNGEISSYGINKRYLEMFGYHCTLLTDTEVIAYLLDLLLRRHKLPFEKACAVLAPPFWKDIDHMPDKERETYLWLRTIYASAALNGPFAFLLGFNGGLLGLNDRVKLRPLLVATKGDTVYMSSEESSIRCVAPDLDDVWAPVAGEPVIVKLNGNASN